jgi:hypothetical protein
MSASARSVLSDDVQAVEQSWQILVEGDASIAPAMIEELRKTANHHGVKLVFVSKAVDTCDLRLILSYGTGKTWDTNQPLRSDEIRFPVFFAFSTAVVLSRDNKLAFTVAQSGNTLRSVIAAVAKEVVQNLEKLCGALQQQNRRPNSENLPNQRSAASTDATVSNISNERLPSEPGVYYKALDGLLRLEDCAPNSMKSSGMATALLSAGIAGIHVSEIYNKPRSSVRVLEQRPIFYIVGFRVSEQDIRIIRLQQKKDHREIRTASLSGFSQKLGYKAEDVCEVTVLRVSDNVVSIAPKSNLNDGEYLLSLSPSELRYDFGVFPR